MSNGTPTGANQHGRQRPPSAWRSALVTFGPSLLLNSITTACTVTTLRNVVRRSRRHILSPSIALFGAVVPWLYLLAIRPRILNWGAQPDEVTRTLPGDELVPDPSWVSTRAVTIAASAEAVWPWLAQMGQDRGGLYSLAWLENLAGLDFHNADRIHLEWQAVAVGDVVRFAPGQDTMAVAVVEPNRALVWRMLDPRTHEEAPATWAFILEPLGPDRTRLLQRFRFGGRPRLLMGLGYTLLIELPHFVMEWRMLLGIRSRAEGARANSGNAHVAGRVRRA